MGSLSPVKKMKQLLPGLMPGSGQFNANVAALMTDLFAFVMHTSFNDLLIESVKTTVFLCLYFTKLNFLNYYSETLCSLATFLIKMYAVADE